LIPSVISQVATPEILEEKEKVEGKEMSVPLMFHTLDSFTARGSQGADLVGHRLSMVILK
jgi:hypothetical protein